MIKPFKLNIPDKALQEIYTKVKNYPWHEMPSDGGWNYGTNFCLLYTSPSPRDLSTSRMPSSA